VFAASPRQTRPVGLSASGTFDLDFSVLDTLGVTGGFDANDPVAEATDVVLLLEIDSRASATQPTWVDRCH
jgi:hypothetical protein